MTKPWRPHSNVVPLRRRKRWTRADAYWASAPRRSGVSRTRVAVVLCAAVSAGLAVGLYRAPSGEGVAAPDAAIEWNEVQALPKAVVDSGDRAWAERAKGEGSDTGLPRAFGARNDAVKLAFSFCHTGSGTNCVVDGDTFYLSGEKVRIAGIDAPETHDYGCASEKALGDRATAELRALLNSGAVTMTSIDRDRDTYGRRLRNVAVDGADVGEALISAGVAREYGSGQRGWC